jgi:hypothetical protein
VDGDKGGIVSARDLTVEESWTDKVKVGPSRADASDDELACMVIAGVGADMGRSTG